MEFKTSGSAGFLTNHMARLFAHGLARRIEPLGLAPAQFMILLELWEKDGRTQKELVQLLDVEQATIANTLARMERDGLVKRKPNEADGRSQLIYMTARAKSLKEPAITAAHAQNTLALGELSKDEISQFLDLIRRVIARMKASNEEGAGADREDGT